MTTVPSDSEIYYFNVLFLKPKCSPGHPCMSLDRFILQSKGEIDHKKYRCEGLSSSVIKNRVYIWKER